MQAVDAGGVEAEEDKYALAAQRPREGGDVARHLREHNHAARHLARHVIVRAPEEEDAPHNALPRLEPQEARVHRQHEQARAHRLRRHRLALLPAQPPQEIRGDAELQCAEQAVLSLDAGERARRRARVADADAIAAALRSVAHPLHAGLRLDQGAKSASPQTWRLRSWEIRADQPRTTLRIVWRSVQLTINKRPAALTSNQAAANLWHYEALRPPIDRSDARRYRHARRGHKTPSPQRGQGIFRRARDFDYKNKVSIHCADAAMTAILRMIW